jgi:hypothetical protein
MWVGVKHPGLATKLILRGAEEKWCPLYNFTFLLFALNRIKGPIEKHK